MGLGVPELLIILAIVVVLFGAGRISGIGGELGEAIKNFRQGIDDGNSEKAKNENQQARYKYRLECLIVLVFHQIK